MKINRKESFEIPDTYRYIIDKEEFQELTKFFTKHELILIFNTSYKIINKLIVEWNVELPQRGYWSSLEGRSVKKNRIKFLESSHYLGYLDKLK